MRRKPFRFPLRTQMVCLLFSRQLLGYLVNMYQWHAWPIPNALSIYHTVDCRTIAQIDNKFIKYYLLNDFSTPKIFPICASIRKVRRKLWNIKSSKKCYKFVGNVYLTAAQEQYKADKSTHSSDKNGYIEKSANLLHWQLIEKFSGNLIQT